MAIGVGGLAGDNLAADRHCRGVVRLPMRALEGEGTGLHRGRTEAAQRKYERYLEDCRSEKGAFIEIGAVSGWGSWDGIRR